MAMDLKLDIEKDLRIVVPLTSLLIGPTLTELAEEVAQLVGDRELDDRGGRRPARSRERQQARPDPDPDFVDHPLSHWPAVALVAQPACALECGLSHGGCRAVAAEDRRRRSGALPAGPERSPCGAADDVPGARRPARSAGPRCGDRRRRLPGGGRVRIWTSRPCRAGWSTRRGVRSTCEQGPLFRARSVSTARMSEPILLLVFHHIIGDFWSIAVLMDELGRLYPALLSGGTGDLAPLALGTADFARGRPRGSPVPEGERLWAYWRAAARRPVAGARLPDRPAPAGGADRPRGEPVAPARPRLDRAACSPEPGPRREPLRRHCWRRSRSSSIASRGRTT